MKNINHLNLLNKLGQDLFKISKIKGYKQTFRLDYIGQIVTEWEKTPGKSRADLLDLPNHYKLKFSKSAIPIFEKILSQAKSIAGLDTLNRRHQVNFYLLADFLRGRSACLTVKTISKYVLLFEKYKLTFPLNELNTKVIALSPGRKSKELKINGFPLDFSEEKWAPIFGIILDTCLTQSFLFSSIDKDLANYVLNAFKKVGLNPFFKKKNNNYFIKGHNVIRDLLLISGINTRESQISSNITLPAWIFNTSQKFKGILLSKFLDTEGSVCKNKGSVRFTQATRVYLNSLDKYLFLRNANDFVIKPGDTKLRALFYLNYSRGLKEMIFCNPPLILICIQLLLRDLSINSHFYPLRIILDSNKNYSSLWNLHIQTNQDLNRFYQLTKDYISIKYKLQNLMLVTKKRKDILPKDIRKSFYLNHARKIELTKGYFTIADIINTSRRNKKSVSNTIGLLERKGYIFSFLKSGHTKHRRLTEQGRNYVIGNKLDLDDFNRLISSEKPSASKEM
jgi:hypothetical protein